MLPHKTTKSKKTHGAHISQLVSKTNVILTEKFGGQRGNQKVYQFEATYPYAYVNEYDSTIEAAKAVSVEPREVYDCCMSRTDLAGGYDWSLKSSMQKKDPIEQYGTYVLIQNSFYLYFFPNYY